MQKRAISTVIFAVSLLMTSNAYAGGYITANTTARGTEQNTPSAGTRFAYLDAGNSYCCEFLPTNAGAQVQAVATNVTFTGGNITAVDRTATTPALASAFLGNTGNRLCLTPTATGIHTFTVTTVNPNPTLVDVQCNETTLFGGYNTNANPFNFLEISNLTNATINGKIYATNYDGTVVINGSAFSVAAGLRADVNIHEAAGPNAFGILKIVHDGPLGALQANTSFYSGPVDALELQATVAAKVRDRR